MIMEHFAKKSHTVTRGYTYNYYTSTPSSEVDPSTPALLFSHGWPDDACLWQFIAPHFASKYRMVIPDNLGAGQTSKPQDLEAYSFLHMTRDYLELLDAEGIKTFVAIGHDWGVGPVSRLCVFAPQERIVGAVFLNVPYLPPSDTRFDLEAFNQMSMQFFGYEMLAYWYFFTSEEAGEIMSKYPEKVWELCHGAPDGWMKKHWGHRGAARDYLLSETNEPVDLKPYAQDPALRQAFIDRVKRDGMNAWQNWYRAQFRNVHFEAEQGIDIPKERLRLNFPVLFVGCEFDSCSPPAMITAAKEPGLLPDLEEVVLSCGHWSPFEKPKEVTEALDGFLQRKF